MINEIKRRLDLGEEVDLKCVDIEGFSNPKFIDNKKVNTEIIKMDKLAVEAIYCGDVILKGQALQGYKTVINEDEIKYFKIKNGAKYEPIYTEQLMAKEYKFTDLLITATKAVEKGCLSAFTVNSMDHSDRIGDGLYLGVNMTYHGIENEIKGIEKMIKENKTVEQEVKESTFDDLIEVVVKAVKDRVLHSMQIGENKRKGRYINFSQNGNSANEAHYENYTTPYAVIDFIKSLYTETFVIESEHDMRKMRIESKGVLPNGLEFKVTDTADNMFDGENDLAITVNFDDMDHNELLYLSPLKGATVTQQKGNNNTAFNLEAFKNQAYTVMTKNLDQDIARFNEGK